MNKAFRQACLSGVAAWMFCTGYHHAGFDSHKPSLLSQLSNFPYLLTCSRQVLQTIQLLKVLRFIKCEDLLQASACGQS